jgi:hypothetical protein
MAVRTERKRRCALGEHLTSNRLMRDYILPEIAPVLTQYLWVDLFAGKDDLSEQALFEQTGVHVITAIAPHAR